MRDFWSNICVPEFDAKQAKYLAKMVRSIIHLSSFMKYSLLLLASFVLSASAADAPAYPLTTCVISGEKLGGMGKPVKITHDGTEVQFCCKSCLKDFNADPAKYVKMVKDAAAKK